MNGEDKLPQHLQVKDYSGHRIASLKHNNISFEGQICLMKMGVA